MNLRSLSSSLLLASALLAAPPAKDPLKDVPQFSGDLQNYWTTVCARCHGANGNGRDPNGKQLPDAGFDFTDSRKANRKKDSDWVKTTLDGKEKMPAFKARMTEADARKFLPLMRAFAANR